jgi:hypothetical protein
VVFLSLDFLQAWVLTMPLRFLLLLLLLLLLGGDQLSLLLWLLWLLVGG